MGIVGLDEGMVGHAQEFKVPFVLGGCVGLLDEKRVGKMTAQLHDHTTAGTLTPARERLHLCGDHALVPTREPRDDCLVKFDVLQDVVLGGRPPVVPATEVDAHGAPGVRAKGGELDSTMVGSLFLCVWRPSTRNGG